jgi:small subunit ribosomal protein S6
MNKYEIMFIVKADIDEKTQKDTVKTFEKVLTDMKSKIVSSKDMGQKKLAYPIKDQVRGNYYVLNVEATAAAVKEFDRKAKIDENILRHIVIREEE